MRKGLNPFVSMVLVVLFGVAMMTLIISGLKPTFDRARDTTATNEALQNLPLINTAIKEVASESQGSRRTLTLTVTYGTYKIDHSKDWLYFDYDLLSDLDIEGTIGDIKIEKGDEFLDYFNHYIEDTDASSTWTVVSGTWKVEDGEYSCENGLAYHNLGKNIKNFEFSGKIRNITGIDGEILVLPISPTNVKAMWFFDENSGTVANDYSLNDNDGNLGNSTISTRPSWKSGDECRFDGCLNFDGTDDFVNVSDSDSLDIGTSDFTIEAWIKTNSATQQFIIDKKSSGSGYYFYVESDGKLHGNLTDGTNSDGVVSSTSIKDNTWHHAVFVVDRDGNGQIYVDGNPDGSPVTITATGDLSNNDNLYIGVDNGDDKYFNGYIDEVRIFNTALSAADVAREHELSYKKLNQTDSQSVTINTSVYLVLTNPNGHTHFDDVKVKINKKEMKMIIPYLDIDLNGTGHFAKGSHQVVIKHMGINSTTRKPIIEISKG